MTAPSVGPLSRFVSVSHLPPEGSDVVVEATPEERAGLAEEFGLVAIDSLVGRFRLTGSPRRVEVHGQVTAQITQTCVVTLEPFEASVDEDVDVDFEARDDRRRPDEPEDQDAADEIVDGRIDVGALAAEFLALGLDPYPRKPGVSFEPEGGEAGSGSPFAALKRLTGRE